MNKTKPSDVIIHFGIRGMKWGIRNDKGSSGKSTGTERAGDSSNTQSSKSTKEITRYNKALGVHTKAQKAVDDADNAWVDAFYKGDKKGMASAELSLKAAQADAKTAKQALKRAEKSDAVLQAEKKRSKARSDFEKADQAWVDAWSKNDGKPDPAADRAFNEARQHLKNAKTEVYKAKTKPFDESVEIAKKKQDAAWKVLEKADQDWMDHFNKTNGKQDPILGEKLNDAQKAYNQATSYLRKEKRSRTFARGSAFIDNIIN